MRIHLVIIFTSIVFLQASATSFAQKITMTKQNAGLVSVFKEIQNQSDYDFVYSNRLLRKAAAVNIVVKDADLEEVLKACFKNQPFTYTIENKTIIIKELSRTVIVDKPYAQFFIDISGKIQDQNGQPLPGASVRVKGNPAMGTSADANGNFALANVKDNDIVVFSYTGYITEERVISGNATNLIIKLKEAQKSLDEVVVMVGYGSVQRKDLTGAVSRVSAEDIKNIPITRVDQMLQGRATGVDVKSTNGTPGAGTTIRIRGARSITASNEPLYVIDGLIDATNLNTINPQDIASIEILKDASATAIYGARAANGVVLVTTKKGSAGQGNDVNFNVIAGIQELPKTLDLMSAREFVYFINEARKELAKPIPYPDPEAAIALVGDEGTNWTKAITRTAGYQTYNLSTAGGTSGDKGMNYYISGNVVDQDGIVNYTDYKKFQGRVNLNKNFSRRLNMGLTINASRYRIEKGDVNFGSNSNWPSNMITLPSSIPLYKPDGVTYESYNPVNNNGAITDVVTYIAMLRRNNNTVNDLQANSFLELEVLKGLKVKSSFGTSLSTNRENYINPSQLPSKIATNNQTASASTTTGTSIYLLNENLITYDKKINDHHFNILGGFTYENRTNNVMAISVSGLTDDVMLTSNFGAAAQANRTVTSSAGENTKLAYLGRVNYDYKGRYYLTATGRYDGASNFAAKHKWGFFPSMGMKWRVSEENFFKNATSLKMIDNLAFRFSYGLSGNQGIGNYQSLAQMGSNASAYVFGGTQVLGFTQTLLPNSDLTWETSAQVDVGLDISLFKGRLNFDANYYKINTKDLLLNVAIPQQTGYSTTLVNLGKTETKGFEFMVSGDVIRTRNFTWNSSFNLSTNDQTILDIGPLVRVSLDNNGYGANTNYMEVGVPIGANFGVDYRGTWKSQAEIDAELAKPKGQRTLVSASAAFYKPGKPRYEDTNGDGNLTQEDYHYIGTPNPKVYGGFGNRFNYRRLSLDIFWQYSAGNTMFNSIEFFMGSGSDLTNQFAYMANRWTPQNPTSDIPAVNSRDNVPSTRELHDASLLRLKSAQISYSLSGIVPKKIFRQCDVFVTGANLLLFTKYNGFDPEVNKEGTNSTIRAKDDGNYPYARTFALGINIGL
ncbi:MAG: TonB-dependent receptor [Pedobacter sp.]|nr:TonB-dependent receptor [Pedobacter sp.]